MRRRTVRAAVVGACALVQVTVVARASARDVAPIVDVVEEASRFSLGAAVHAAVVHSGDDTLSGPGVSAEAEGRVAARWAAAIGLAQSYSPGDRFAAILSTVALEARFDALGRPFATTTRTRVDGRPFTAVVAERGTTLRVALGLEQSFLNSRAQSYPFSGLCAGPDLLVPLAMGGALHAGARGAFLTNGARNLITLKVAAGYRREL